VTDLVARTNALVRESFAAAAENYRHSRRHGDPANLRRMLALLEPAGDERVLDMATGGGHTAAALAPFVRSVVAFDLLPEMLAQSRQLFTEARLRNAALVCGDVHALPFADGAFDLVTCRYAPHHFADLRRACSEVARCLRPGGRFYLNDCGSPSDGASAAFVNDVERLRDPSHVRALSAPEWHAELSVAGLRVALLRELPNLYPVGEWMGHLNAPAALRAAVLEKLAHAPAALPEPMAVDLTPGRETFTTLRVESVAVKPGP
jgi:ubiquinone/menaquinone biosynthesis C-methylase UbiE